MHKLARLSKNERLKRVKYTQRDKIKDIYVLIFAENVNEKKQARNGNERL